MAIHSPLSLQEMGATRVALIAICQFAKVQLKYGLMPASASAIAGRRKQTL
jgi:hypothetical protein